VTNGTLVSPPAAAQFLAQATQTLFTEVLSTDSVNSTLTMLAGTAEEDGLSQNLCQPTAEIPAADEDPAVWTDPTFIAGPVEISQTIEFDPGTGPVSVDAVLKGVTFSGTFTSSNGTDTDSIEDGAMSFWIDGRDIELGFGETCDLLGFLPGFSCTACPDEPAEDQCIIVWVENMSAAQVPGLDLEVRTQATIDADTTNCP
jgi:hypothetical protein